MEPATTTAMLKNLFDCINWIKSIRASILICCSTGFLLFTPIQIREVLLSQSLFQSYHFWISALFLLALSNIFIHLIDKLLRFIKSLFHANRVNQDQENIFQSLSLNEKKVIVQYIVSREKVHTFPYNDRVIASLQQKNILAPCVSYVSVGNWFQFPFTIREWAQKIGEEYIELFITETVDSEGNFDGYKSDSEVPPSLLQRQFIFSAPQNID